MVPTGVDSLSSGELLELLETLLSKYYDSALVMSSILTLVVYDAVLTLQREVNYVWRQKFAGATVIYLLNRYAYVAIPLLELVQTDTIHDDRSCRQQFLATVALTFIMYLSQAAFASLRLYAIWGHSFRIGALVLALHIIPLTLDEFYQIRFVKLEAIPGIPGCFTLTSTGYFIIVILRRVAFLVNDFVMLGLTWAKTYTIRREALSFQVSVPISTLLLRDGTLHFSLFLALSIIDLIQASMMSPTHTDYASLYISVFRSVTVCHFILHLRQVYLDGTNTSTTASSSSAIQFASQVVGNLGAPLDLSRRFDEEDSIVRDSLTMSSNPLAAGLPVEDRPLVHSTSVRSAVEFDDVFDDQDYGHKYMSLVRRKGTGDDAAAVAGPQDPEMLSLIVSDSKESDSDDDEFNSV